MTEDIRLELEKKEPNEFLQAMLNDALALVKRSRSDMSARYSDWDRQDQVYKGLICPDNDDRANARKGKPVKMIVPNTYAQVMTFASFLFLMFNQNNNFFELMPTGEEDYGTKKDDLEICLARDLRHNQWNTVLFQHLLDIGRFGPAILETSWTRKVTRAFVPAAPKMVSFGGATTEVRPGSEYQEFVKYEGNVIRPISPYRFFPDTSFPFVDFTKGDFCASEEEYTMGQLRDLQLAGEVAGVDHILPLAQKWNSNRGGATRTIATIDDTYWKGGTGWDVNRKESPVIVTKLQWRIVPSKYEYGNEKKLGPEEFQILYHVWIANDNKIIRCEPTGAWHNEFGYTVAQFTPDMHQTLSMGLADLIYPLQDVISWFVNSHITSVRRVMQNRLIIDPRIIDTNSLDGEKDIYLRKGVSVPLERAVGQLKVQDVTSGHMNDVDLLGKLMEVVTGVNGNAMGQYNSGRRSAQEARVVTAGAAGRMKMHGHLIWESSLGRLGKLMTSNLRQGLSFESFKWAIGSTADEARFATFKGTPEEVICGDDFFVFDSTLSSEKGFIAQSLQELLVAIMSNPAAAMQLDLDPRAMMDEIQRLRGTGPISRFSLSKRVASGQAAPLPPVALPASGAAV